MSQLPFDIEKRSLIDWFDYQLKGVHYNDIDKVRAGLIGAMSAMIDNSNYIRKHVTDEDIRLIKDVVLDHMESLKNERRISKRFCWWRARFKKER